MLKRLLHRVGLIDDKRLRAREGEYKNVFCPHCGAFIAHKYNVFTGAPADSEAMEFDCPDCDRAGVVMKPIEYEPLHDPSNAYIGRLGKDGEP